MFFIDKQYHSTLEIKQSKFMAFLVPYFEYDNLLLQLKEKHPKARHFVVAYRYFNEFNQIVEHSSDDGEPKGTSGKPSLFVLQGAKLINTAVIIVRYFGGTKLGTGGLVRAYSDAVNQVIQDADLREYRDQTTKTISFSYHNQRMVDYECGILKIDILNKEFSNDITYQIKASKDDIKTFLAKMQRIIED